jgi:adenosylcobinamide kinase / adenosylcobinamide-phosphate guanylyltransferase
MPKGRKIFLTGGVRSGKSRYALSLAKKFPGPKIFLATAQPFDDEMKERIERHQQERTEGFSTREEPLYLSQAVGDLPSDTVVVLDCLTLWLNNLFFHFKDNEARVREQLDLFIDSFQKSPASIIVISNETGWGIIPAHPLSRQFIEQAGDNQDCLIAGRGYPLIH